MLIERVPWKVQPYGAAASKRLGLTSLILPGQSNQDIVSGVALTTTSATPTRTVGTLGPALQLNANKESIYTSATSAQRSPQGSIVWAGTLTGDPSVAACLGGTTFDASNSNPYVGIEIKRRVVSARTIAVSYSYGSGTGQVENLQTTGAYTTGDIVAVGVFESGRQHIVVRSSAGIEVASGTRAGTLSYGSTARIEVGDSLNNRNPAADCAVMALSNQAWPLEVAIQVANDVWGQLFAPRSIWVPVSVSAGGGTDLTIQDATHAHTADGVTVTLDTTLATADATHAHTADGLALTLDTTLAIAEALHAHTADNLTVTVDGATDLVIADALHSHTADSLNVTVTSDTEFSGGWFPPIRRRTRKEIDDERRRLGILPPEVVEEVAAAPVARRRITLQDLIGKKAAAEITNVDLSAAIAASKRRKRQRDDELLMLM